MKHLDVPVKTLISKASEIIAPLWPMQTSIARNPLQCLESWKFEDAIAMAERFLTEGVDSCRNAKSKVNRELIKWCQLFLDEGQAPISMPERVKGFYKAWALLAPFDNRLSPSKKNKWLMSLPSEAEEAILFCLKRLKIPKDQIEGYLKYSLAELPGWAGYIKWRAEWQNKEATFKNPITLTDFLAVRLLITCVFEDYEVSHLKKEVSYSKVFNKEFFANLKENEKKYLANLLKLITPQVSSLNHRHSFPPPEAQIVFCIDVRSEPLRMRIEKEGNYETFGFAGFFGLPISIHNYNTDQVKACCPVLMKPIYRVFEEPISRENKRICHHRKGRSFLNMLSKFYQDLKYNFATPFALVETMGLWCGFWMAARTYMPVTSLKIRQAIQEKIKPTLSTFPKIDIPLDDQISQAESALRMIGLTKNLSRLIVFCGHRSQTENNPYASTLDCGACGGNHGGPNGKILATILNSYEVRRGLLKRGIVIPEDTLFVGAEHNTTTDEVVIEDHGVVSLVHKGILEKLKKDFIKAGVANSHYRCKAFGLDIAPTKAKKQVLKRSCDWAQVRPEWGLARNAAFIVGPRHLTKNSCLEGRCFLHSYEWEEDQEGRSLETILTAPMVVAEWINTQYFFTTLNNIAYGSGSKITHNVTGKFGIMQGNGSDLMQGLPLQSVYQADNHCYHEPMRLQVIVYAPRSKIDIAVDKHAILQTLVFNHWVSLMAIDPEDRKAYRLVGKGKWVEITEDGDTNFSPKTKLADSGGLENEDKDLMQEGAYQVIC